jgi:hypothetical protein
MSPLMGEVKPWEEVRLSQVTTLLDGDEEGAREVLKLFLDELARYQIDVARISSSQEAGHLLHRLRGAVLALGMPGLGQALSDLEQAATASKTFDSKLSEILLPLLLRLRQDTQGELTSCGPTAKAKVNG